MFLNTPCICPRCKWLGTIRDTHELQIDPPQNICPRCATATAVQLLKQKGLDGLRREYGLLLKMSYERNMSPEEKTERRAQIERFFVHIDQALRVYDADAIWEYSQKHQNGPSPQEGL